MLELYHANGSVCAQKVRLALAEKGIDGWVDHRMELNSGKQFTPEYLALNPRGVVPTLIHDGRVITESTVICEYLEDAFPEPRLRPDDAYGKAMMRKFAKMPDEAIHAACAALSGATVLGRDRLSDPETFERRLREMPDKVRADIKRRVTNGRFEEPAVRTAVLHYDRLLREMDTALAEGPWLAGAMYSLADIGITPYVYRLDQLGLARMWDARPRIAEWYARITARASFETAVRAYKARYDHHRDPAAMDEDWRSVKAILDAA